MRDIAGGLFRTWLHITLLLGIGLITFGLIKGFGEWWLIAAIGAGVLDLWVLGKCVRAWFEVAGAFWFWWR